MSVNILRQLERAFAQSTAMTASSIRKTASLRLTRGILNKSISIHHTYADDVESLLYVLTWIMVMYDGPHRYERRDVGHEKTFLSLWSEKAASDLMIARTAKFSFLIDDDDSKTLDNSVTPYCKDLIPLVHRWRALHRHAILTNSLVEIPDVARVLDDFIAEMEVEDLVGGTPPVAMSLDSKRLRDEVLYQSMPEPLPSKRLKSTHRRNNVIT